jgi:hypothetical protein
MRLIIELHCKRREKRETYDGFLELRSEPGETPQQQLTFTFDGKQLQDVGVQMHHMLRMMPPKTEYCIRMFQKGPNSTRPPVAMDLTPEQINKIYESPESAQIFFSPMRQTR